MRAPTFLALVLVSLLSSLSAAIAENAITVPDDFSTIAEAIAAATPGQIILIQPGVYNEKLSIDKGIMLRGLKPDETFIFSNEEPCTIWIGAAHVVLSGVTVMNYNVRTRGAVHANGSKYCTITGNRIIGGLYLTYCDDCRIEDNNILADPYRSTDGLGVILCQRVTIQGNTVSGFAIGLNLDRSGLCKLRHNQLCGNRRGMSVRAISIDTALHDIDRTNEVDGKPVYYFVNACNLVIEPSHFPKIGYLGIVASHNVFARDLSITGAAQGVLVAFSSNVFLDNLTLTDNDNGLNMFSTSDSEIRRSTLSRNNIGINAIRSDRITVVDNKIGPGDGCATGLNVQAGTLWTIRRNVIIGNYMQIRMYDCRYFVIRQNTVANGLRGPPSWNPGCGIELWYSQDNKICQNNWIGNPVHASIPVGSYANTWDDGLLGGGNFWDTHKVKDANGDGFGDTPYVIDLMNSDRYPLMKYYGWEDVEIDLSQASDTRCDLNSSQLVAFHARWKQSGLDLQGGTIYVNGTPYNTNSLGWLSFSCKFPECGKRSWKVTSVEYDGPRSYAQIAPSPSIVWDSVDIELRAIKERCDTGSQGLAWTARYRYDQAQFEGLIVLNDTCVQDQPGRYGYKVTEVVDEAYGLSVFESNEVSVVYDRVNLTLVPVDVRADVGTLVPVKCRGTYEYDGSPFNGTVGFLQVLSSDRVGAKESTAEWIVDPLYGLTAFCSNAALVIFDRVRITLFDDRIDVGSCTPLEWNGSYEYDGSPFRGEIELNDSPGSDEVCLKRFWVKRIKDPLYNLTAFTSNEASVVYDRVIINLTVSDDHIDVGRAADLKIAARYEFDGAAFDGLVFLNDTRIVLDAPGRRAFTASSITDFLYGLNEFKSNAAAVTWDRVRVLLSVERDRVDVGTAPEILAHAVYEYDHSPISGSVILNDTTQKQQLGLFAYTVREVRDEKYGLCEFSANCIRVIYDTVLLDMLISDPRIDIGTSPNITVSGRYAYDDSPFEGKVQLNDTLAPVHEIGKKTYGVKAIEDPRYGLATFRCNSVDCVFDEVEIELSTPRHRIDVDANAQIIPVARYQYDNTKFSGSIVLNDTITRYPYPCKRSYTVASIGDALYGLTKFRSNTISVVFDQIQATVTVEDQRIDVGSEANLTVAGTYAYDGSPFVGSLRLNDTRLSQEEVGRRGYTVASVRDDLYGLESFRCNQVYVIFDKVGIILQGPARRVQAGKNATVVAHGTYSYDGQPFVGSIHINKPTKQDSVGKISYGVEGISDGLFGLSIFDANQIEVTFDLIRVEQRLYSWMPGRLRTRVELRYESDMSAVEEARVTVGRVQAINLGMGIYTARIPAWSAVVKTTTTVELDGFDQVVLEVRAVAAGTIVLIVVPVLVAIVGGLARLLKERRRTRENL